MNELCLHDNQESDIWIKFNFLVFLVTPQVIGKYW